MDNEKIIREFIEAWSRLDAEELSGYFTEDGVYHNMPSGPCTLPLILPRCRRVSMCASSQAIAVAASRQAFSLRPTNISW